MSPDGDERKIHIPRDVTFSDLWKNTPARYVIWLAGSIVSVFVLGTSFGVFLEREILNHSRVASTSTEMETKGGAPVQPTQSIPSAVPQNAPVEPPLAPSDPRDSLRKSDDVTLIDATQNQTPIEHIPYGRFGYVIPASIEDYLNKRLKTFPVFFSQLNRWFEIHKTLQGEFIIGFITKNDLTAFDDPVRQRRDYNIFSYTYKDNTIPVKIPLIDITRWQARDLPGDDPTIAEISLQAPSLHH